MSDKPQDNGGPAFPPSNPHTGESGMTLREYAAIKLRAPHSGTDWLDDMIREAKRDEFAGQALTGLVTLETNCSPRDIAHDAYLYADAMPEARKAKR